jgi:hypothetical protein
MRGLYFLPVACLSISLVSAQSLSGPVIGFTFDGPTLAIRAVNGLPGSATLGPAVLSALEFASPAPFRTYGVGFKNGQALLISGLGSSQVSTENIPGIFGVPEGAVWSADGSHVSLFSRSEHWIQTLSGLPGAPVTEPHQDLAPLGGLLCDVAINSAGGQVAIAMCGRQAGVYLSAASQQFTPLERTENPIALAFSVDGASLYVLDSGARKLAVIQLSDSSVQELTLPELAAPFAIRAGLDASKQPVVYVASRRDRLLGIYSLVAKKMEETFPLNFEPTGFQALGSTTFVIASRVQASDALWLLSTQPHPAVYFVPAGQAAVKGVE